MKIMFHYLNVAIAFTLVFSLFLGISPAMAQTGVSKLPIFPQSNNANYVPGEVVVGLVATKQFPSMSIQAQVTARNVGAQFVKLNSYRTALMRVSAQADVHALVARLRSQPGVAFAEPNYIYALPVPVSSTSSITGQKMNAEYVIRKVKPGLSTENKNRQAVPIAGLQSMKRNSTTALYPNDPYLWWNGGWSWVSADILTGNATASANVCEIDTGVDNMHPDLAAKIVAGYDFVNADIVPMDDNGHGTHVAGIMVAVANNKMGIAGVSTGKVVAVKALDAQGSGTNYDIAAAINYCANRLDIKVINMSFGSGNPSTAIYNAINYAVNVKGKLAVMAAGNDGSDVPVYPAGYSDISTYPEFANKVISVAAEGSWYEDPPGSGDWWVDYGCRASYSNYGSWVSVVAPGTSIYSTLPWDKPFYLNYFDGLNTRYDSMDGTSMAAPFVSAVAARRWGYMPLETNTQIGDDVIHSGAYINADGTCWDGSMVNKQDVNVAYLLDRGAFSGSAYDAVTGLPLTGATVGMYQGTTLKGSAIVTPWTWKADPSEPEPTRVYTSFNPWTDVVNLPAGGGFFGGTPYVPKVNLTGYTASPQAAWLHSPVDTIFPGWWVSSARAAVPPKSGNFDVTSGWWVYLYDGIDIANDPADPWDLDTNVWLPNTPNPLDAGQFAPFIVGPEGDAFGFLEGDPYGMLTNFPSARMMREGGWTDWLRLEDITIAKRAAHGIVAANMALPYYPGDYVVMMTDWGQTIDHDADGCGDNYGYSFDPYYDNTCGGFGTPGIPLLGTYYTPWIYVWKDGVIKSYAGFNGNTLQPVSPGDLCNAHWWKGLTMTSGLTGTGPVFTINDECGDAYPGAGPGVGGGIQPYSGSEFNGRLTILKK